MSAWGPASPDTSQGSGEFSRPVGEPATRIEARPAIKGSEFKKKKQPKSDGGAAESAGLGTASPPPALKTRISMGQILK